MHFNNQRNVAIINKKQSRRCPYHSRVSSVTDQSTKLGMSVEGGCGEFGSKFVSNRSSIKEGDNRTFSCKLPKIKKFKSPKTSEIQVSIQPEYASYGQRLNLHQNYYQDLKLENEGWPSRGYHRGRLAYVRHEDIFVKAQKQVKRMYEDQYFNVRGELEIINRIKERYKVLRNIQEDKNKYQNMLKEMIKNTYDTDDEEDEEKDNGINDSILNS